MIMSNPDSVRKAAKKWMVAQLYSFPETYDDLGVGAANLNKLMEAWRDANVPEGMGFTEAPEWLEVVAEEAARQVGMD